MSKSDQHPTKNEAEQMRALPTFVPFAFSKTKKLLSETLLFAAVESDYHPLRSSGVSQLIELYRAALENRTNIDDDCEHISTTDLRLRQIQLKIKRKKAALAKSQQQMAAYHLVDAVFWGIHFIDCLAAERPAMMRKLASTMTSWPIEVSMDMDSHAMLKGLEELNLGRSKTVEKSFPRFHPAQGNESQLPARTWARFAALCLAQTRDQQKRLSEISEERIQQYGCEIEAQPKWALDARKLPDFSAEKGALQKWQSSMREMIRQQCPDFHDHPDFAKYKSKTRVRSKKPGKSPTKGDIQNAILDDIAAAMKTIAPRKPQTPPA